MLQAFSKLYILFVVTLPTYKKLKMRRVEKINTFFSLLFSFSQNKKKSKDYICIVQTTSLNSKAILDKHLPKKLFNITL